MAQKETSSKSRRWLGLSGAAVLVANLVLTGTTIAFQQEGEVNHALGIEGADASYGGTEFSADGTLSDASYAKYIEAAYQFCEQEEEEGSVLLYNRNNALPLSESERNVTVFGRGSIDPVFRSTAGGSSTNPDYQKTPVDALQDAGFNVNQTVLDAYASAAAPKERSVSSVGEYDPALFTGSVTDSFASYGDVAFVTLSRFATEGNDLAMVNDEGKRMLELDDNEKAIFQKIKDSGKFKKTVVLLNSVFAMEMDWLDEYNVDAVLWVGNPGFYGMPGAIRVVTGEVNPSGHSADTFVYDLTAAPYFNNIGDFAYTNADSVGYTVASQAGGDAKLVPPHFVNYVEGIYVGYKFYETAAAEGLIDYDKTVQYPFGHGLSYTTFTQKIDSMTEADGTITLDVTVTNTGSVAGKDAVQVYFNPPYTDGGIEKASANLVTFGKTDSIEPGASQTLTLTFNTEDMASFDSKDKGCYVLEEGDYIISINEDSHTVLDSKTYNVASTIVYDESNPRSTDAEAATTKFDFADDKLVTLSRADHFANYAEAVAAPSDYTMSEESMSTLYNDHNWTPEDFNDPNDEMPVTGANNGLKLADLRGADYDDERWDTLLDQMTVTEMDDLIALGGYQTKAEASVDKYATIDCDGPAAINNNFTGVSSIGFPSEIIIASTFNTDLARRYGESIGRMASEMNVTGWYAPAMNGHRSAFDGRNFEYYSEDSVLAGYIGASSIAGAQSYGVYAYMKHFALNDQEGNRTSMLATWSNEQAIREIYLKPFEMSVKDADCHAVMSSFNYIGNRWAGGCSELLQNVLRGEWGFLGFVETDYFGVYGYMTADQGVRNGSDLMLCTTGNDYNNVTVLTNSSKQAMRTSAKNILYTVVNSRAYEAENLNPGMAKWKVIMIGADVVVALLIVGLEYTAIKNYKKRKEEEEEV